MESYKKKNFTITQNFGSLPKTAMRWKCGKVDKTLLTQRTGKDKSRSLGFLSLTCIHYGKNNDKVEGSVSLRNGVAAAGS